AAVAQVERVRQHQYGGQVLVSGGRVEVAAEHVGEHLGVVDHGAVAAHRLGGVQSLVGGVHQGGGVGGVRGEGRHAEAHGRQLAVAGGARLLHGSSQPLGQEVG